MLIDAYHKLRYMQWVAAHSTSVLGVPLSQAYLHASSHSQTKKTQCLHTACKAPVTQQGHTMHGRWYQLAMVTVHGNICGSGYDQQLAQFQGQTIACLSCKPYETC